MRRLFRIPIWRILGYGLLLWGLGGGFSSQPRANREGRPEKAWLDAGESCVLPVDGDEAPANAQALGDELSRGLRQMAVLPSTRQAVSISGDFPTLRSLGVDLSGGLEDSAHKPPRVDDTRPFWSVGVANYQVRADPLIINGAKIHYTLTASDATLELRRDKQNRGVLLLTGAKDARFEATVDDSDIQALCSMSAKGLGNKFGFDIRSCAVKLTTVTPRQIDVRLHVKLGRPIGGDLVFTARMVIGDDLSGRVSNISCRGNGPTGILISTLLTPVLLLQNGMTRPLLEFPGDRMGVRDVAVKMDEPQAKGPPPALHLTVDFGDWKNGQPAQSQ